MSRTIYHINEFVGIDQSHDENGLKPMMSPDACNMDTTDGNSSVARGCVRHIQAAIPGDGGIHALKIFSTLSGDMFIAAAGESIYAYKDGEWKSVYTYSDGLSEHHFDFVQAQIASKDYLIIASGEKQLVKFDGTTAAPFGSEEELSNKAVGYLAMYRSRLFSAGDKENPNRLYWSQLPGGTRSIESWGPVEASPNVEGGHTEVGSMKSDPIVGLAALSNQLIIFKQNSIYRLLGDKPSNFIVEEVEARNESTVYTAIVKRAGSLFFLTKGGLCIFNGVNAQTMADARRIQGILKNSSTADSRGAICRDKLYFTISENNKCAMIEYDLTRGAYMLRRGFTAYDICSKGGTVYLVNENRCVCRLDEGTSYDGAPVNAYWQTPKTDLYDKGGIKAMRALYLRGQSDDADSATLIDVTIGGCVTTYRTLLPKSENDVLEVPLQNEGRTFCMRIYNEAGGSFTLKSGMEAEFDARRRSE